MGIKKQVAIYFGKKITRILEKGKWDSPWKVLEGNSKLGRLLLKEKAKKNKETKIFCKEGLPYKKKEVGELKGGRSTHWRIERNSKDSHRLPQKKKG